MDRPPLEWIPAYIPGLLSANAPPEMVDELIALLSDIRPAGAAVMLRGMAEADLRDVLPRIAVPTLLVCGEHDVRSPLAVAEELHASIPGSTLVVLPGVGHASNFETPDQFNHEVRSFLRSIP